MSDELDAHVHPLPRFAICSALAGLDWVEFAAVRDAAQLSDSMLSKHARALEDVGYLEIRKGYEGRRPRTWLRLTAAGRAAFTGHLAALRQLTDQAARTVARPA